MTKITLSIEYFHSGRLHFTSRVIEVDSTLDNPAILRRFLASIDGDTLVNVPLYMESEDWEDDE